MKKHTIIILSITIVMVLGGFVLASRMPNTDSITVEQITQVSAQEFVDTYTKTENAVLLDVRTPEEFSEGHMKSAINIDFYNPSFLSEIQKLDSTKTYFVYCRSGNRSGQTVELLKNAGITKIYELQGGIISAPQIPLVQI